MKNCDTDAAAEVLSIPVMIVSYQLFAFFSGECLIFISYDSFLGLTAKVIDRTKSMSDVYGAFYDFSCMLNSKV